MDTVTNPISISRVRRDGQVEPLGRWHHEQRLLELDRDGFPFLGPGRHAMEGELPWIFWDMCPSGYLGRRLQARFPALRLAANPRDWTADDCVRALTHAGHDLAGNLLIGDDAVAAFLSWTFDAREVGVLLDEVLRDSLTTDSPSSLGGERPKLLGYRADGTGYLVKFSPHPVTPQGLRWADLLRMEAHCSATLAAKGITVARSNTAQTRGRTTLHVQRFDRLPRRGRVGAATLYWLAMDRYGDVALPAPEVVSRLHGEGLVDTSSVETCARVHAFSAAIGNNDAHLGNYGLVFDDAGRATLAPLYDVLPMALAPRNDELPDDYLTPRPLPEDPTITAWVDRLAQLMEGDSQISDSFKDLWRRTVGLL
jgi:HipA-like C-terminal domain